MQSTYVYICVTLTPYTKGLPETIYIQVLKTFFLMLKDVGMAVPKTTATTVGIIKRFPYRLHSVCVPFCVEFALSNYAVCVGFAWASVPCTDCLLFDDHFV